MADLKSKAAAELEGKLRLVDQDRVARGKLLRRIRDMLVNPRDHLDDAGDLVAFGSTNDADTFRDAVQMLEDWRWDDIMREGKLPDLVAKCRKANKRATEAEARVKQAVEEEREVLLFTSYCGGDTKGCTDRRPCAVCLGMSNVFRVRGKMEYVRQLSPDWLTDVPVMPGDHMRQIEKAVERRLKRRARTAAAAIRAGEKG